MLTCLGILFILLYLAVFGKPQWMKNKIEAWQERKAINSFSIHEKARWAEAMGNVPNPCQDSQHERITIFYSDNVVRSICVFCHKQLSTPPYVSCRSGCIVLPVDGHLEVVVKCEAHQIKEVV